MRKTLISIILTIFVSSVSLMMTGCENKTSSTAVQHEPQTDTDSNIDTPAESDAAPSNEASANSGIAWSELNDNQKSVLSILEMQWDSIPSEKQNQFLSAADNWSVTESKDQYLVIEEMYGVLGQPIPDVYKESILPSAQ